MIFVYVTCKNSEEAKKISNHLLNKKLIACSNIFPIQSVYKWKGKTLDCKEIVLILKTFRDYYKKVEKEIKKVHSYDIPFIGMIDVKVNKEYEKWSLESMK